MVPLYSAEKLVSVTFMHVSFAEKTSDVEARFTSLFTQLEKHQERYHASNNGSENNYIDCL